MAKTFAERLTIQNGIMAKHHGWYARAWESKDIVEVYQPLSPAPGGTSTLQGLGNMAWQVLSGDDAALLV